MRTVLIPLVALALSACKGSDPAPTGTPPPAGSATKAVAGAKDAPAAAADKDALTGAAVLELIPDDALFVAVGRDFSGLVERLGRGAVVAKLKPLYDQAVGEVIQATGRNYLDPATLPEAGIDPRAPFGFVWLDGEDETVGFFATLSDPEKFKTALYDLGGRTRARFQTETVGEAIIVYPAGDQEIRFVLRGKHALMIVSDRGKAQAAAAAQRIAKLAPEQSIARDARMAETMARLAFGRDVAGYLNMRAVTEAIAADITQDHSLKWAERELEWAKERGDTDAIQEQEARVAEARTQSLKRLPQRKAQELAVRAYLAPILGLGLGIQVDDAAVRFKLDLGLTPESHYRRMIGAVAERHRIFAALDGPALFAGGVKLEPDATLAFVRSIATAIGGGSPADLDRELNRELGRDLEGIFKLFDGEAGFAVRFTGDLAQFKMRDTEPFDVFSGALVFGLRDAAGLTQLIERIRQQPFGNMLTSSGEGRWTIQGGRSGPYFELAVVNDALVFASDKAVVDRLLAGKDDAFVASLAGTGAEALLTRKGAAAAWLYDWMTQVALMARIDDYDYDYEPMEPAVDPKDPDAPRRAAEAKARADRRKTARAARKRAEQALLDKMIVAVGPFVGQARGVPTGLVVEAAQYVKKGTIGEVIGDLVAGVKEIEDQRRKGWEIESEATMKAPEVTEIPIEARVEAAPIEPTPVEVEPAPAEDDPSAPPPIEAPAPGDP